MEPGNSTRIEQLAAEWLARRDAGDWGADEQAALDAWLATDTAHRVAYLRLQAAWREAGRLQALAAGWHGQGVPPRGLWTRAGTGAAATPSPPAAPPDWTALRFAPREREAAPRRAPWLAAGMAGLLAVGLAWGGWQLSGRQQASYATAVGQVRDVVLADGSSATLSSGTRLDVALSRGERRVSLLQGEALFDVAHDRHRPFVVQAGHRRVVAVGTRFSVRQDADALRVVVTEGKVRLDKLPGDDGRAQPAALLPAGSMATAGNHGVLVRTLPLEEAQRYLGWREGFVEFDDATLAEASAEFNRYNQRRLEIGDPAVAALRIGGSFRWANVDSFATLLEQGFPVRAERHPDRIVLRSR